jgi:hypothetical protein
MEDSNNSRQQAECSQAEDSMLELHQAMVPKMPWEVELVASHMVWHQRVETYLDRQRVEPDSSLEVLNSALALHNSQDFSNSVPFLNLAGLAEVQDKTHYLELVQV